MTDQDAEINLNGLLTEAALMEPISLADPPAWVEHIPFAFWLMETHRPRILVELGTHSGNSYLAFCQAVVQLKLPTKCFAVDTWKGDEHAGFYDETIFQKLSRKHHSEYGTFSRLVRSTFDEAVQHFSDKSIDLLHIDGYHTYEAAKHDFETWRPKLSERAVVLFHDTNVRENNFGIFRLWEELAHQYSNFEFFHGYGLGVAGIGTKVETRVMRLFAAGVDDAAGNRVRSIFSNLGRSVLMRHQILGLNRRNEEITKQAMMLDALLIKERAETKTRFGEYAETIARERDEVLARERAKNAEVLAQVLASKASMEAELTNVRQQLHESLTRLDSGRWLLRGAAKKAFIRIVGKEIAYSLYHASRRIRHRAAPIRQQLFAPPMAISPPISEWKDEFDRTNAVQTLDSVCDVIIPVYNAPYVTRLCVECLFANTPDNCIRTVIVSNDGSDHQTREVVDELARRYPKLRAIHRSPNVGYVRNVNAAIAETTASQVLLLNSDCFVGPHTIFNLLLAFRRDETLGLASPLSNNAGPIEFPMAQGCNYRDMEEKLNSLFSGVTYSACTIVGNCLMISRRCIDAVGLFSDEWGAGYGEESDYQFRALEKGLSAKIVVDAYVFHHGGESFGKDPAADQLRKDNHAMFLKKWGTAYRRLLARYIDPVAQLKPQVAQSLGPRTIDVAFILPTIRQAIGGTTLVVDIVNELNLRGISATIVLPTGSLQDYADLITFGPVFYDNDIEAVSQIIRPKIILATQFETVQPALRLVHRTNAIPYYFVQGFEPFFENAQRFNEVCRTYAQISKRIIISDWLKEMLEMEGLEATKVVFGPNTDIFYPDPEQGQHASVRIVAFFRGAIDKGDWVAQCALRQVKKVWPDRVTLSICDFRSRSDLVHGDGVDVIRSAQTRAQLGKLFRKSDIFLDCSMHEGYGRLPVEAMASGVALVCSNSGGNSEYARGEGVHVVSTANSAEAFVSAMRPWIENPGHLAAAKRAAHTTAIRTTFRDGIDAFASLIEPDLR